MICRDEADRVEAALQSVAGWADEIVVFDSGSTDATPEIVRRYTDRLFITDWPGFGVQRQRCLEAASGDWVLLLDADERITPALRHEIDGVLASRPGNVAYQARWETWLFGKRLRFAGRFDAPQTRLYPRGSVQFPPWPVHETPELSVIAVHQLRGRIEHHSFRDYRQLATKHLDYGCLLAEGKFKAGKRASMPQAVLRAGWEFLSQYLLRGLVFEGGRGLLLAAVLAQYAFHKYAALYVSRLKP
jgi:glycosyltransferase involved in cell wall biosynthesis